MTLSTRVLPPAAIDEPSLRAMFALFERYYDHVTFERFASDLRAKDRVFLLRERDGRIVGFSTLVEVSATIDGRTHHAVFSGDTVLERSHWNGGELQRAFVGYMLRRRLRHPLRPLWWFLISKGYKTYLLMANNFAEHYPRHERPTPPAIRRLMDALARDRFGDAYDPSSGVLVFHGPLGQLKPGVAEITPELKRAQPRVGFFAARNPNWRGGDELVCLARMDLLLPLRYALKRLRRGRPRTTARELREAEVA